jgi:hypothetical protein
VAELIGAAHFYGSAISNWSTAGDDCLKFAAQEPVTIIASESDAKPFVVD